MSGKWLVHCVTSQGVHTYETNEEPIDLSPEDDQILKKKSSNQNSTLFLQKSANEPHAWSDALTKFGYGG